MVAFLIRYGPTVLCLGAIIAGVGYVYNLRADRDEKAQEVTALEEQVAAYEAAAADAAFARDVEVARLKREAQRDAEFAAALTPLQSGEIPDEMLDPRIADLVNSVQRTAH